MWLVETASAPRTATGSSQVRPALRHVLGKRQLVGKEDRIEQPGLGASRQILVIAYIGERQRRGCGMAPRRLVVTAAMDEQVEVQLPYHDAVPHVCRVVPEHSIPVNAASLFFAILVVCNLKLTVQIGYWF